MSIVNLSYINLFELGHTIQLSGMLLKDSRRSITFLVPLHDDDNDNEDEVKLLDLSHDDWKTLLRQMDIQEVEVLANDNDKIKKAILRKSTRQISAQVSWNVYRRDNYTCRYCGKNDVPLTVDHLILWEDGGPSIEENLVACCGRCNKVRGNIKYADWLKSRQYKSVSKNLNPLIFQRNIKLVDTLDLIPIQIHKQSRKGDKKKKRS